MSVPPRPPPRSAAPPPPPSKAGRKSLMMAPSPASSGSPPHPRGGARGLPLPPRASSPSRGRGGPPRTHSVQPNHNPRQLPPRDIARDSSRDAPAPSRDAPPPPARGRGKPLPLPPRRKVISAKRDSCISIVRDSSRANVGGTGEEVAGIICLDQEALMEQIKAEEMMERRMSMVRNTMPLPSIPPSGPPSHAPPSPDTPETAGENPDLPPSAPPPQPPQAYAPHLLSDQSQQEIVTAFLQRERQYMGQLEELIEQALTPVRCERILSSFQIVSLFSSLEMIYLLTKTLLEGMEEVINDGAIQSDEELLASLADLFTDNAEDLSAYINYCANLPSIGQRIQSIKASSPGFESILKTWEKNTGSSLKDSLHVPKNRVTAYNSFLHFLQENTSSSISGASELLSVSTWDTGHALTRLSWMPPTGDKIAQVACGGHFFALLTDSGSVYTWGESRDGALALGPDITRVETPTRVALDEGRMIRRISAGDRLLALIDEDNYLFVAGLLPASDVAYWSPSYYTWDYEGDLLSLSMAGDFAFALTESTFGAELWAWGSGSLGQLGLGADRLQVSEPTLVEDLSGFQVHSVHLSTHNVMALTANGVYVWGSNSHGATGLGDDQSFYASPQPLPSWTESAMIDGCCGQEFFFTLSADRHVYGWGDLRRDGMLGTGTQPTPVSSLEALEISQIVSGGSFCWALSQTGDVYCWGHGQGVRTSVARNDVLTTPTLVKALSSLETIQLACSPSTGMALHMEPPPVTTASRIHDALTIMEDIKTEAEDQIKQVENISTLLEIDQSLTNGREFSIVNQQRIFIMKTPAKVAGMDGLVYLFSDSLLLCKRRDKKRMAEALLHVDLVSCIMGRLFDGTHHKAGFEVRDAAQPGHTFWPIEFASKAEQMLWKARIEQQMEQMGVSPPKDDPPTAQRSESSPMPTLTSSTPNASRDASQLPDLSPPTSFVNKNLAKVSRFSVRTFQRRMGEKRKDEPTTASPLPCLNTLTPVGSSLAPSPPESKRAPVPGLLSASSPSTIPMGRSSVQAPLVPARSSSPQRRAPVGSNPDPTDAEALVQAIRNELGLEAHESILLRLRELNSRE